MSVLPLLPILSGFLIGTSYIPFPPWASLFCFVPLWIYWNDCRTFRQVFVGGWMTGFVLALVGYYIGNNQELVQHYLHQILLGIGIFAVVLVAGYVFLKRRARREI